MKHTPGPWSVGGPTEYAYQLRIEPSIGVVYGGGEEVQANAHLIAAAPEMRDALELLTDRVEALFADEFYEDIRFAREVIAKAKGDKT